MIATREIFFFAGGLFVGFIIGARFTGWVIHRSFLKHRGIDLKKVAEVGFYVNRNYYEIKEKTEGIH